MTMTIQQAIDTIITFVPGAPLPDTVDTIKTGDPSQEITGIVVTFLATGDVIEKAAGLGANFIITHEPIFYNHLDETGWLDADPTYAAKRKLLETNHIVIWRFHDYLHSLEPDSTIVGLLKQLGWEAYSLPEQPFLCNIPAMTLLELGQWVKERLGTASIRMVGDMDLPCRKIALLPGFPPSEMQIGVLGNLDVDALLVGEIHEWETSEYVRDSTQLGHKKGLIVMGHSASEEPGIRGIIPWLQERLPGIAITFVPTGSAFQYL